MRSLEQYKASLLPSPEEWENWTLEERGKALIAVRQTVNDLRERMPKNTPWIINVGSPGYACKLELIKWMRRHMGCSLMQAKNAVEALPNPPIQLFALQPEQEQYLVNSKLAIIEWREDVLHAHNA